MKRTDILPLYAGFSIIPIQRAGKRPAFGLLPDGKWERYQRERATEEERRRWVETGANIAVVGGRVSGNLVVVDFDDARAYETWLTDTDLETPTVQTANGYHVYLRYGKEEVPGNTNVALAGDAETKVGEIRGEGGYAVAPPSVHETGVMYEWVRGDPRRLPEIRCFWDIGIVKYETAAQRSEREERDWQPGVRVEPSDDFADYLLHRALRDSDFGLRNDRGMWLAVQLRDNRFPKVDAERILEQYQRSVPAGDHPYTVREALATVDSVYRDPPRRAWRTQYYSTDQREDDFFRTNGRG